MRVTKTLKGREEEMQVITGSNSFHGLSNPLDLTVINSAQNHNTMTEIHADAREPETDEGDSNSDDGERDEVECASQGNETNMNVNTNGITSTKEVMMAPGGQDLLGVKRIMKIRQINMGEMPLEPMGVSVSGSGLQLFVKLDTDLQKALDKTVTPKPIRKHGSQTRKPTTRCQKKDDEVLYNPLSEPLDLCKRQLDHIRRDVFAGNEAVRFNGEQANHTVFGNLSRYPTYKQDELTKVVYPKPEQNIVTSHMVTRNEFPRLRPNFVDVTDKGHTRHTGVQPLCCNNCSSCGSKKDSCHHGRWNEWNTENKTTMTVGSHNIDSTGLVGTTEVQTNTTGGNQTRYTGQYESSNVPLTSTVLNNYTAFRRDLPETGNRGKRKRHGHCSHQYRYPNHLLYRSSPSDSCSSVQDKSDSDDCDSNSVKALQPRQKRRFRDHQLNNRAKAGTSTHRDEKFRRKGSSTPDLEESKVSHANSSVGPSFDTTRITTQTMDSETLVKFTDYTQDMRKDLKRRYKDLSELVRDFGQKVKEKNGMTDIEVSTKNNSRELEKRCVVM